MIPTNAVARHVRVLAKPPRKVGKSCDPVTARRLQDDEIARMDSEGVPRWKIAAVTNLSERQVYRRLRRLRETREFVREMLAEMI
jgi:transposase-like protein